MWDKAGPNPGLTGRNRLKKFRFRINDLKLVYGFRFSVEAESERP
jgi:hypothetical protein